ncbi:MAG: VOC family protein [Bacteriovoracaceae bacterium]
MKMNHIGIVVKDIKKALKTYVEDYGHTQASEILEIENQKVRVVLLNTGNDVHLELIEPSSEDSPVMSSLKRGGGINHICYEVDDIEATYEKFKAKVVRDLKPAPEEYFKGGRTFFIYRKGDLIEFLEK